MVRCYRELIVWQKAVQLAIQVYELSRGFPREELYGLTSQMRRSAISVPSKIAEGAGRMITPEYRHFLGLARGSIFELQTQIVIARKLGFGDGPKGSDVEDLSNEVGKMISATISGLREDRSRQPLTVNP